MKRLTFIRLDIETVAVAADDPRWLDYLATDPPTGVVAARVALAKVEARGPKPPDGRLTDPAKIAASAASRLAEHADEVAAALAAVDAAAEEARAATSFDPLWGRVVCVGVAVGRGEPVTCAYADEDDILHGLAALLRASAPWMLVGWNVAGFDVPFLRARAMLCGVPELRAMLPAADVKPWEAPVIDLMKLWPTTRYGAFARQRHVARALGLPAQPSSGADVAAQWAAGDVAAIAAHCAADVAELLPIADALGVEVTRD